MQETKEVLANYPLFQVLFWAISLIGAGVGAGVGVYKTITLLNTKWDKTLKGIIEVKDDIKSHDDKITGLLTEVLKLLKKVIELLEGGK